MMKSTRSAPIATFNIRTAATALVFHVASLVALFSLPAIATAADGKALLEQKCVLCHTTERIEAKGATKPPEADWSALVDRMKSKGCPVTDQEKTDIVTYLTTTYSSGAAAAPAPATPAATPAAPAPTATTAAPSATPAPAPAKTAAETDPEAAKTAATPEEQAQTGAEDWVLPLLGMCMVAAGVRMRRSTAN